MHCKGGEANGGCGCTRKLRGGAVSYRLANWSVAMSGDHESTVEIQERRSLPAGSELLEATPCV